MNQLKKIYLANPRGFCAGVKYAISYVDTVHKMYENENIYVRKEIVHNRRVVEDMQRRGIRFITELDEVPDNSIVIFSAHGVSPTVNEYAEKHNMRIGDATCPLVNRVHRKARRIKDSYQIIYIGHKGHDEAIGTMGEAKMWLVESPDDVEKLRSSIDISKPLTYLMQTTLSISDTKDIVKKIAEVFPHIEHPEKDDICYATTERQEAVESMMPYIGAMLVIGAPNSSNSLRLVQLAQKMKPASFRVSSSEELSKEYIDSINIETMGITAGASTPQVLIDEIISQLKSFYPTVQVGLFPESREDTMNFKLPKVLLKEPELV